MPSADPVALYPISSFVAEDLALGHGHSNPLAPRMDPTEPCLCHLSECNIGLPLRIRMGTLLVHPTLLVDIGKNPSLCTIPSVLHHGMEILNGLPTDVWRFSHRPWTRPYRRRHTKAHETRNKGVSWISLVSVTCTIHGLHGEAGT